MYAEAKVWIQNASHVSFLSHTPSTAPSAASKTKAHNWGADYAEFQVPYLRPFVLGG